MKLVRKLVPVDFLDMHGIESWLEDMAARGLFFTEMGSCFARFRRGRPMPIRYHAEPSGSVPASLAREQVDYSAGRGWHYAGPFGQAFAVYWADDPETEEFHTDPVAQSYALEHLSRRLTRSGLVCVLAALVMAALFLWAAADSAPAAPAAGYSGSLPEGNRFEQQKGRRMTYTAELSLQVDNLPDVLRKAEELVKAAGGYVQESGDNGGILRIPVEKADEVLRKIEAFGTVGSRRNSSFSVDAGISAAAFGADAHSFNLPTVSRLLIESISADELPQY